jgi:hypothetical protein
LNIKFQEFVIMSLLYVKVKFSLASLPRIPDLFDNCLMVVGPGGLEAEAMRPASHVVRE